MEARNCDELLGGPFEVIAHRGASAEAPENTLPAFLRAAELAVPAVELDVQLSRDGVPMLYHDRKLRRKTGATGCVRDYTEAQLRELDIGSWFDRTLGPAARRFAGTGLMSLEDLFRRFGARFRYQVELKSGERALAGVVVRSVERFDLTGCVTLTSFTRQQLSRAGSLAPGIACCWLVRRPVATPWIVRLVSGHSATTPRDIRRAQRAGFSSVAYRAAELTPELVTRAHSKGLGIRAWSVRNRQEMEHVIRAGADGMTVDDPGLALEILGPARL